MADACQCNLGFENTGVPNCQPIAQVAKKLIVVPLYANDGTRNQIDLTATLDAAYFSALINNTDSTKRFYPLPLIDNVEDVRADSITETLNSGQEIFVQKGTRTFTGVLVRQSSVFYSKIDNLRCFEFGIFVVDKSGNIIGSIDADDATKLNPIQVDQNTWNPILVKTTDTTVQKVQINFAWSSVEEDGNLRIIEASEIDTNALNLSGLLDVNSVISAISTTGFTNTMTLDYGSAVNKIAVEGWVASDFSLYNNTTAAAVVITSTTESSAGVYDFIIPAQTSADNLTLSGQKDGYEMPDVSFDIP